MIAHAPVSLIVVAFSVCCTSLVQGHPHLYSQYSLCTHQHPCKSPLRRIQFRNPWAQNPSLPAFHCCSVSQWEKAAVALVASGRSALCRAWPKTAPGSKNQNQQSSQNMQKTIQILVVKNINNQHHHHHLHSYRSRKDSSSVELVAGNEMSITKNAAER